MASDAPGAPRGPRGGLRELASPGLASPTALADAQEGQGRRGLRRRRDDDGDGGERTGDPGGAGEAKDDGVASKPQVFAVAGVYDLAEAHGALEKPLGLAATIPVVCTIIDDLLTTGLPEIINHKGATYYELAGPREPARYDAGALKSQVKFSRGNRLLLLFEHALRGYVAFVLKNDLELQVDGDDASDRALVVRIRPELSSGGTPCPASKRPRIDGAWIQGTTRNPRRPWQLRVRSTRRRCPTTRRCGGAPRTRPR